MLEDEETRPAKKHWLEKLPLDALSVDDLKRYITELQAEIMRVEEAVTHKQHARGHADSFFKPPSAE